MPLLFGFDGTFDDGETQLPLVSAARFGPSLTELASERPTMQVMPGPPPPPSPYTSKLRLSMILLASLCWAQFLPRHSGLYHFR